MGVRVRKKGGKYYLFINHKGKRKAKMVGSSRQVALAVKAKVEAKLALGDFKLEERAVPTLAEYSERWLATYAQVQCRESTVRSYEGSLRNYVLPHLGDKRLSDITREDIKGIIYRMLTGGLSKRTVVNAIAPLREMLSHAMDDGLISFNPALRVGCYLRQREDKRLEVNPLTREEIAKLLECARRHYPGAYPLFLCAARTGLRMGELLGLQWGDIDFGGGFIEVRRAIVRGKEVAPKSGKIRRVDLSEQLADTLKALHKQRMEETLQKGWRCVPEWVFVDRAGGLLDDSNIRKRVFYPCLEEAGLRRVRFHDLRHSFASLLIQQGESLVYVKEQLGHHSIQVTVDIYGHLIPGANKAAVDRLDDAPKRNLSATPHLDEVPCPSVSH